MSGPIVRKYGFANFDKIFGQREIPHGQPAEPDDEADPARREPDPAESPVRADPGSPPGADATPAEKASEDSAQL